MSLGERDGSLRLRLLPEFVHARMWFRFRHWKAAGRMCGVTTRVVGPVDRLAGYRAGHYEDLVAEYGQEVIGGWLSK